ncbi:fluoride efflux transporter CrcB [Blastococcus goldschmidtiae]|uniref:Fluoride-specific ion channel FluC n=1 Tax=Blastococcus goldschmidtiae TaxID=3075546 RepID=A0ABU2K2C9_9ACTN|nr:fluoride efflux transporter CrcB [Blastococcus sp. DSM 46792]MDT0274470.1 fluoride efflux transporter CrcB [Blastococcus sp. DSM 46792]
MVAYVAAALGGALGALARWGVAEALPYQPGSWPTATLLVNVAGCLLLGLLIGLVDAGSPWLRPFLGTGVLGGFTTYSAFAVETVQLTDAGRPGLAAGYVAASVLGGVAASALGTLAGRAAARSPEPFP